MILTCSACATRYLVDPASIGSAGREVRCARCGHLWFQSPPPDLPKDIDDDDLPIIDPMAYRPAPNLPALRRPGPPWGLIVGWAALFLTLAGMAAGFYQFRERLVALWPASAHLYEAVGLAVPGLQLRDLRVEASKAGDMPLLIVSGMVVNASGDAAPTPKLRLALRDNVQREIAHEEFEIKGQRIGPGGQAKFTTRLTNPPPEARDLEVSLVAP